MSLELKNYITPSFEEKFSKALALDFLIKGDFSVEFHVSMFTVEGESIFMNVRLTPVIGLAEIPLILSETRDISVMEYSANKFKINHLLPYSL
jgi:hypothetical protein